MTLYRLQKTIDISRHDDVDGEFSLHEIIGVPNRRHYANAAELRDAGWDVTKITRPQDDPPGTIRRFGATGDECVKDVSGQWRYLDRSQRTVTCIDISSASSEVIQP